MLADVRQRLSLDRIARSAVGRHGETKPERLRYRAQFREARRGAERVAKALARLCLRPRYAGAGRRESHSRVRRAALRRIALIPRRPQQQPVAYGPELISG